MRANTGKYRIRPFLLIFLIAGLGLVGAAFASISRPGEHADLAPDIVVAELRMDNMNSWLIYRRSNPADSLLIDTGLLGNEAKLAQRIRDEGVDPAELDAIIITHGHYDHIGGARRLREQFGTPVIAGAGDANIIAGEPAVICPTSIIARFVADAPPPPEQWHFKPDRLLEKAISLDTISSISGSIEPLPGHTQGSLIIKIGDGVFVGDLLRGKIFGAGPARHFFMCDLADNDADIRHLIEDMAPGAERIFPGHLSAFSVDDTRAWLEE